MKLDIPVFSDNLSFTIPSNPDNISTIDVSEMPTHNSNQDYYPFYAFHNGSAKIKNPQLILEEIRILELRVEELKIKLQQIQDRD